MEETDPHSTEPASPDGSAPGPAPRSAREATPAPSSAPAAAPEPALPPGFTLTPLHVPAVPALERRVSLRVLRRDVDRAVVTFVAFTCAGLLGLGAWVGVLAILGVWSRGAWPGVAALIALAVLVGALAGARHLALHASCSDPLCDGVPAEEDRFCPGCGREIVGTYAAVDGEEVRGDRIGSHLVERPDPDVQ